MTPTTPSPIADQAAGERFDVHDIVALWNSVTADSFEDELAEFAKAVLAFYADSTAPTTGSTPVAEYLAFAEFLESAGKSDIDAAKEIDTESYEPDDPTDIAMGLEFTGENYLKAAKIIRALLAASMGGDRT